MSSVAEIIRNGQLVDALGLALLHSLWQGVVIGVLFTGVLKGLRGSSPNCRYWAGVVALALLALMLPATTLYVLAAAAPDAGPAMTETVAAAGTAATRSGPAIAGIGPDRLVEWIVALWAAGVAVVSARTLQTWRGLNAIRRAADLAAAADYRPVVERLATALGLRMNVAIGFSESIGGPMVIGWLKPTILLPTAIATRMPREQLEMVIAHELAHLRRHDHWVNLFQVAIETLLFYHPAVALVSRRIRIERENACDDLSVTATRRRLDYVEMLASLEYARGPAPALSLGVADGQILARIRRLVERGEPRAGHGAATPTLIVLVTAVAVGAAPFVDDVVPGQPGDTPDPMPAPRPVAASVSGMPAPEPTTPGSGEPPRPGKAPTAAGAAADPEPTTPARSPERPGETPTKARQATPAAPNPSAQPSDRTGPETEQAKPDRPDRDPDGPEAAPTGQLPPASPAEQTRKPRLDPALLLARRVETPAALPDAAATKADERVEPIDGNGRRAAEAVLSGGELLRKIEPAYPARALRREIDGSVQLELAIDRRGRVSEAEILEETPANNGFGQAARKAATQWQFEPFKLDGKPVDQRKTIVFKFDPGQGCQTPTGSRIPRC